MKTATAIVVIILAALSMANDPVLGSDLYSDLVRAERISRFGRNDSGGSPWRIGLSVYAVTDDSVVPPSINRNLSEMLYELGYVSGRTTLDGMNNGIPPAALGRSFAGMLEYLGYVPDGVGHDNTITPGRTRYASAAPTTSVRDIRRAASDSRGNSVKNRGKAPVPVKPAVAVMLRHLGYRL
ncbi:MAG: hypothetical protein V2B18_20765 [Pseudomonadota bacterium]